MYLEPIWGGSCWFYPGPGIVVGKAEALLCRGAVTRLGTGCCRRLPFINIENEFDLGLPSRFAKAYIQDELGGLHVSGSLLR